MITFHWLGSLTVTACMVLGTVCVRHARAEPPRVVTLTPEFGQTGVDSSIAEIRVEFDQDMDSGGQSICGGGPAFPTLRGKAIWQTPRVLIVPVKLQPGRRYELSFNCAAFSNFRSATGEPAEATSLVFQTAAAGEDPVTPRQIGSLNENAVAALRRAIDARYSHRDRVVSDWPALFAASNETLLRAPTSGAFARAAVRMLGRARDVHLWVSVGDARAATFVAGGATNADIKVLERTVPNWTRHNDAVMTGKYLDGVVYVLIAKCPGERAVLEPAELAIRGAAGVVLDLRFNGGGDDLPVRAIASLFTRETLVYARVRTRDPSVEGGWTQWIDRVIGPSAGEPVAVPVAVLMGPRCVSSCESFLLMLRHGGRATLIGEASAGSSGNPKPVDLGNGVVVWMPSWQEQQTDGSPIEGRGVQPDQVVRFVAGGSDAPLEAALAKVRGK